MTSILQKIDDSIRASRKDSDIIISESIKNGFARILISARMDSCTLALWQDVYINKPDWLTISFKDDCDDDTEPSSCTPGNKLTIDIKCTSFENNRYIFTIEGWNVFLHDDSIVSSTHKVNILGLESSFETFSFLVEPWISEPIVLDAPTSEEKVINTQTYIKFYSNGFMPSSNIYPWILKNHPRAENPFYKKWLDVSCNMLARCLVNELLQNGDKFVCLSGKPPKKLPFGNPDILAPLHTVIQDVNKWIFIEGQEIELKHTFLTCELAREWPENISFCDGLPKKLSLAFESAKLLYKAHIRTSSKETIKSLSDLRKTLTEDTQKIVTQSKDMASALWKDLALVISVVAIKYTLDASKIPTGDKLFPYIFFALAAYIFISQITTIYINNRFFKILNDHRLIWRKKLYSFLDDEDYKKLAIKPISDAYKAYRLISTLVFLITITTSLSMTYLGISLLGKNIPSLVLKWVDAILNRHFCV